MEIEATRLMLQACHTLVLPRQAAIRVARSAPWILSYRPERSKRVLGALAVSLGMSREELSHCVSMYPRLLSLSVDAKISAVLRSLTLAATRVYIDSIKDEGRATSSGSSSSVRQCHDAKSLAAAAEGETSLAADLEAALAVERGDGVTMYSLSAYEQGLAVLYERRRHTVRSMVRSAVLRYPLVLGTSMERIDGRLAEIHSGAAAMPWPEVVSFIRRDAGAHERWKGRQSIAASEDKGAGAVEGRKARGRPRKTPIG